MPAPAEAWTVARQVFATRATHDLPLLIPDPPASWSLTYTTLAGDLDVQAATVPEAMTRLNEFWAAARMTEADKC